MDDPSVPFLQKLTHHHIPVPFDAIREHPCHTQDGHIFTSLYLSLDLKVTAPLCIPSLACSNNQPTHQWDIHHHRAERFSGPAPQRSVGIAAADYRRAISGPWQAMCVVL